MLETLSVLDGKVQTKPKEPRLHVPSQTRAWVHNICINMCIYYECCPIIIPFIYFPLVVPFFSLPLLMIWVIVLSMFTWGRVQWSPDPQCLSCWEKRGSTVCWCKWGVGSHCEVMYNSFLHTCVSLQPCCIFTESPSALSPFPALYIYAR